MVRETHNFQHVRRQLSRPCWCILTGQARCHRNKTRCSDIRAQDHTGGTILPCVHCVDSAVMCLLWASNITELIGKSIQ